MHFALRFVEKVKTTQDRFIKDSLKTYRKYPQCKNAILFIYLHSLDNKEHFSHHQVVNSILIFLLIRNIASYYYPLVIFL